MDAATEFLTYEDPNHPQPSTLLLLPSGLNLEDRLCFLPAPFIERLAVTIPTGRPSQHDAHCTATRYITDDITVFIDLIVDWDHRHHRHLLYEQKFFLAANYKTRVLRFLWKHLDECRHYTFARWDTGRTAQ